LENSHKGLLTKDKTAPNCFAIAGADSEFVWAKATIEGSEIVVWSDQIAAPVSVRYAWADNPEVNLYSTDGLPVLPFRTGK